MLGRKRIRFLKDRDYNNVKVISLQKKPLGDNTPDVLLPISKMEQNPFYEARRGGGDVRIKTFLLPLDLVDSENLGKSVRENNKNTFFTRTTNKTRALVPEKVNLDGLTAEEILSYGIKPNNSGWGISNAIGSVMSKGEELIYKGITNLKERLSGYGTSVCEQQLGMLDKTGSFCNYCTTRCKNGANPLGLN